MNLKEYVTHLRRKIHQYPELGFREYETQKLIIEELEKLNIPYKKSSTKTGVIAEIGTGARKEKIIAFRADIDALPIQEETDKPYSSKIDGKMHACGHDSHTAILLGFAREIVKYKDKIQGKARLIFQPNEEGNGACHIIEQGALEPKPEMIFGLHVTPFLPTGSIGLKYDELMAGVDNFKILLTGVGGHAAMPHHTPDIILAGACLVQALNTIIPRNIVASDSAVVTVTKISSGANFNIIPKELEILGTIRTFAQKTKDKISKRIHEISENYAKAYKLDSQITIETISKPLYNNKKLVDLVKNTCQKNIVMLEKPSMGGEDFSEYLEHVPGCFIFLGIRNEDKGIIHSWHNPKFDVDEDAMPVGVNLFVDLAKKYFELK
ncbi:M20 family metallopeptidase [bacterium]